MTVPAPGGGVQPVDDDRLQCLECGHWYRQLPPHLRAAHDLAGADYRARHQLPTGLPLRAPDLGERASAQGKARYADRPDIRANLDEGRALGDSEFSVAGSRATARYEGVRAARRRGGAGRHAKALAEANAAAQRLGFADLAAFLTARSTWALKTVAAEIGMGRSPIRRWYTRLGIARVERADRDR